MFGRRKEKDVVSNFSRKSEEIFDVFAKTQRDIQVLNAEIAETTKAKEAQIQELQSEVSSLNSISTKNTKLANKIEAFLND